jgi:hypothetical protein
VYPLQILCPIREIATRLEDIQAYATLNFQDHILRP